MHVLRLGLTTQLLASYHESWSNQHTTILDQINIAYNFEKIVKLLIVTIASYITMLC